MSLKYVWVADTCCSLSDNVTQLLVHIFSQDCQTPAKELSAITTETLLEDRSVILLLFQVNPTYLPSFIPHSYNVTLIFLVFRQRNVLFRHNLKVYNDERRNFILVWQT